MIIYIVFNFNSSLENKIIIFLCPNQNYYFSLNAQSPGNEKQFKTNYFLINYLSLIELQQQQQQKEKRNIKGELKLKETNEERLIVM